MDTFHAVSRDMIKHFTDQKRKNCSEKFRTIPREITVAESVIVMSYSVSLERYQRKDSDTVTFNIGKLSK